MWCIQVIYGATIAFLLELFSRNHPHFMPPRCEDDKPLAGKTPVASDDKTPGTSPPQTPEFDPYKSSRFVGHSLWMIPTGAALKAYDDIVGKTSNELDTFHFVPHITLVAALMSPVEQVIERTRHLASLLSPYEFELDDLSQKDAYFQCVFATMKRTDAVVHANAVARQVFAEKQSDPPYMPHLSLLYGDFDYERKVQDIIPKLRQQLQHHAPDSLRLPVDAIEIWSTQGDVKEWYLVERIPLTGSNEQSPKF